MIGVPDQKSGKKNVRSAMAEALYKVSTVSQKFIELSRVGSKAIREVQRSMACFCMNSISLKATNGNMHDTTTSFTTCLNVKRANIRGGLANINCCLFSKHASQISKSIEGTELMPPCRVRGQRIMRVKGFYYAS